MYVHACVYAYACMYVHPQYTQVCMCKWSMQETWKRPVIWGYINEFDLTWTDIAK